MLRAVLIGLGALFTLGMIAASMTMNFLFGFGFGTSAITAWVWGGLSIASDGLKSILPVLIAYQTKRGNWMRALVGLIILPLVLGYGFLSALGFWAESRGLIVDGRSNEKAAVTSAQAEVTRAEKRLAALPSYRLAGVIEADLTGLQRERLWVTTDGCTGTTSRNGRIFCKRYDGLRAELALNREAQALGAKMDTLKSEIKSALTKGAWRQADPLVDALAWVVGRDATALRTGLSWMAAILVETVSCFGLLVVEQAGLWAGMTRAATAKPTPQPAWRLVGKAGARG